MSGNQASGPKAHSFSDGATRLHYVWDAWNRPLEVWQDDGDGNFIPMAQWDPAHWPPHIHPPREAGEDG